MELNMRKEDLLKMCKEMNIKAVSSKNKEELVSLIRKKNTTNLIVDI